MAPRTLWSIAAAALALAVAVVITFSLSRSRPGGQPPIPSVVVPTPPGPPLPSPSPTPDRPIPPPTTAITPPPPPPPLPTPRITDRFDEVDAALAALVVGNVAFNAPERMRFDESRIIALVASPKMDAATLSSELRGRIGGADRIEVEKLQVGPLMEAQLEGAPAFEIAALTPTRQPVSRETPTEWRWSVQARESGKHALHLTINAIITVDGERFPRSLDVLNREIEVEITAPQRVALFVEGNWQWLAGTIVIPMALWFWTNRRRSHRKRRSR